MDKEYTGWEKDEGWQKPISEKEREEQVDKCHLQVLEYLQRRAVVYEKKLPEAVTDLVSKDWIRESLNYPSIEHAAFINRFRRSKLQEQGLKTAEKINALKEEMRQHLENMHGTIENMNKKKKEMFWDCINYTLYEYSQAYAPPPPTTIRFPLPTPTARSSSISSTSRPKKRRRTAAAGSSMFSSLTPAPPDNLNNISSSCPQWEVYPSPFSQQAAPPRQLSLIPNPTPSTGYALGSGRAYNCRYSPPKRINPYPPKRPGTINAQAPVTLDNKITKSSQLD